MAAPSLETLTNRDIIAALQTQFETGLTGTNTAVIARRVQMLDDVENTDIYKNTDGEVKALLFWRSSILPPPSAFSPVNGQSIVPFDPRTIQTAKGLRTEVWTYSIKLFYQFNDEDESDNSTLRFNDLLDSLNAQLARAKKLGLNSYRIDRHSGAFWSEITERQVNDNAVHIATGTLSILVHAAAI